MKYSLYIGVMLFTLCLCGCSDETLVDGPKEGGTELNMYVSTGANTRLAELGEVGNMFKPAGTKGYKNIGLYIYYEDDYNAGDLSKPYIRNLECHLSDVSGAENMGKLAPVNNEHIYIYDRMTIVAFYPYNASMSEEKNYFENVADEKAYPITESDYSQQLYIPYRTDTKVNPTNAYMVELHFKPQQTCKVEVVLVADNEGLFPTNEDTGWNKDGKIKLLPDVDRYDGTYQNGDDLRENWVDNIENFPKDDEYGQATPEGGKYVRRYTAYVWKSSKADKHHDGYKHDNNNLKKGDLLFKSDKLMLTIPTDLNLSEETVYRYGYNLNTGEIFIPTSDRLVYDAVSLEKVSFNEYRAYQVCDVDLTSISDWTPKLTYSGTYDGGGHKISHLKLTATPTANVATEPGKQSFGLFANITGKSTLMNIDLVNPEITVDYSNTNLIDTCYVGALCGIVNPELSDEQKRQQILDGLPPELSQTVKEALVADRMKNFAKTTCYIRGCKVTDPVITATGENLRVGGLCGGAGNQSQMAAIYDSYVWQTAGATGISVNAASAETKTKYTTAYVAGFCGMMTNGSSTDDKTKGGINDCYSTLEKVTAYVKKTGTDGSVSSQDIAQGFYNPAPTGELSTISVGGCYTKKADTNTGVTNFSAGWPTGWKLFKDDTTVTNGGNMNYLGKGGSYPAYQWTDSWYDMGTKNSVYPTLVWEHPLILKIN